MAACEHTLALIKPDALPLHHAAILQAIDRAGFIVIKTLRMNLTVHQASDFYAEHAEKPFFPTLVSFMCSGPIMALVLSKNKAIADWRALLGPTNSIKAREVAPESLRAKFGTDGTKNAGHGSDSPASARREIAFFFPDVLPTELPTQGLVRDFLECSVYPVLTKGLVALCTEKPANPTEWLGKWLLENNPKKPVMICPPSEPSKHQLAPNTPAIHSEAAAYTRQAQTR